MSPTACGVVLVSLAFLCVAPTRAQEAVGENVVVSAAREPIPGGPFATDVVSQEDLQRAPELRLDDILRAEVPGFSLFRRTSSAVANPTTQGVTLRNFGPSGAGRTLVLVDGIPLNDPFAGYVLWNQLPPASVGNVVVAPGGGAGLFGNAALAGTIFIESRQAEQTSAEVDAVAGSYDTYDTSLFGSIVDKQVTLSAFAARFSTSGYPVLQANQRGPVDNTASATSYLLQLGANVSLGSDTTLTLQARGFREDRGNGTIYTRNDTTGEDASAIFAQRFPALDAELRISAYGQVRKFRSTFSSINAARTIETPSLDQYDVPADAIGGSVVWAMPLGEQHSLTLGLDTRWITGETNEFFRFVGDAYTRDRNAGGEQLFVGIFGEDRWKLNDTTTITGGARVDRWQLSDGSLTERDIATGAVTLQSPFPDRDGYALNGRLGLTSEITHTLSLRVAGYTGFRVPTLNELYRPFRVGNVLTEANASLNPEQLLGGEAGAVWQPVRNLRLAGTFFYNYLEDAVGNVTISSTPSLVTRERENISLVSAPGVELSASWQIVPQLFVRLSYLFTQPVVQRAAERDLIGKLLAETPEQVTTGAIEWKPEKHWLLTTQLRYTTRQFEDDQNQLPLAAYFTLDAAVFYNVSEHLSLGLKGENLLNTDIETGKTTDGLVSIGEPRLISFELRYGL